MRAVGRGLAGAVLMSVVLLTGPPGPASATQPCSSQPSDFNGDGDADLATGTYGGKVAVTYGSASGLGRGGEPTQQFGKTTPGLPVGDGTPLDGFGAALASGYFDDDCYADLAVGTGNRNVVVLYGSAQGLGTARAQRFDERDVDPQRINASGFGTELASGDLNGDGRDDLVAGVFGAHHGGALVVLYGQSRSLAGVRWLTSESPGMPALDGELPMFGYQVAVADYDGDGRADVAASAPGASAVGQVQAGAVVVLRGTTSGPTTNGVKVWHQDTPGVPGAAEYVDGFGTALVAGDLNKDGRGDLVIGTSSESVGGKDEAGSVTVLYGSATGLTATGAQLWTQGTAGVPGSVEEFDQFGRQLASGDLNRDGAADLVIGTQYESVDSHRDAGTVTVLFGGISGLTATGATLLNQATPGVPGTVDDGNQFGGAVHVLPGTRDRYASVMVRHPLGFVTLPGSASGVTGAGAEEWTADDFSPALPGIGRSFG